MSEQVRRDASGRGMLVSLWVLFVVVVAFGATVVLLVSNDVVTVDGAIALFSSDSNGISPAAGVLVVFLVVAAVLGMLSAMRAFRAHNKARGSFALLSVVLLPSLVLAGLSVVNGAVGAVGQDRLTRSLLQRDANGLALLMKYGQASRAEVVAMLADMYEVDKTSEASILGAASDLVQPLLLLDTVVEGEPGNYQWNTYMWNVKKDQRAGLMHSVTLKNDTDAQLLKTVLSNIPKYPESRVDIVGGIAEISIAVMDAVRNYAHVQVTAREHVVTVHSVGHESEDQHLVFPKLSESTLKSLIVRSGWSNLS
jgi:hypothetical protein